MEQKEQKEGERYSWLSGQDACGVGHADGFDCGQGKWHERWTEKGYSVPCAGYRQMRVAELCWYPHAHGGRGRGTKGMDWD